MSRAQDDPTDVPDIDTDVRGRWWLRERGARDEEGSEHGGGDE